MRLVEVKKPSSATFVLEFNEQELGHIVAALGAPDAEISGRAEISKVPFLENGYSLWRSLKSILREATH